MDRLNSVLKHWEMLGGQPCAYCDCHFMSYGSKQILLNYIYFQPNIRLIPIMNNKLNPITVFPF